MNMDALLLRASSFAFYVSIPNYPHMLYIFS